MADRRHSGQSPYACAFVVRVSYSPSQRIEGTRIRSTLCCIYTLLLCCSTEPLFFARPSSTRHNNLFLCVCSGARTHVRRGYHHLFFPALSSEAAPFLSSRSPLRSSPRRRRLPHTRRHSLCTGTAVRLLIPISQREPLGQTPPTPGRSDPGPDAIAGRRSNAVVWSALALICRLNGRRPTGPAPC